MATSVILKKKNKLNGTQTVERIKGYLPSIYKHREKIEISKRQLNQMRKGIDNLVNQMEDEDVKLYNETITKVLTLLNI